MPVFHKFIFHCASANASSVSVHTDVYIKLIVVFIQYNIIFYVPIPKLCHINVQFVMLHSTVSEQHASFIFFLLHFP